MRKRGRRVRRNFSIREKAKEIRSKMTVRSVLSFVTVAGLRSFIGQQASDLAKNEEVMAEVKSVGAKAMESVTKSFAGMSGFKQLDGLGRDW